MPSKSKKTSYLWTFVVEFEGGTYISQFSDLSIYGAIEQYNQADPSKQGAVPLDDEPVEISGVKNVWCCDGDNDGLILANIVCTSLK